MKIIIAGAGKTGSMLADCLSHEGHDVALIDTDEEVLRRVSDRLDVMCVKGNGAAVGTLGKAGAERADLILAVTGADEVNMVSCLTARHLGVKHSAARIRSVEYSMDHTALRQMLGIDTVINPEYDAAAEISRLLAFPSAASIHAFCRGRVELVSFVVQQGDFLAGQPLTGFSRQGKNPPVVFCAAEQEGGVVIPDSSFIPKPGCRLYLLGEPAGMQRFFRLLGCYLPDIGSVFIVGGGCISHYLASMLQNRNVEVKIVERNEERCHALSEDLRHALIICGDGTDQELLESERFSASNAFLALTDRDEDNLILSLHALQRGISKVIAKYSRQNYAVIAHSAGLHSVVSPGLITAGQVLRLVRGMHGSRGSVNTAFYQIADGRAAAMDFVAEAGAFGLGIPLGKLGLKKGVLIAAVIRNGKVLFPEGSCCILAGDSVIIVSLNRDIRNLSDIYETAPCGTLSDS